jgi:hypothetical protein
MRVEKVASEKFDIFQRETIRRLGGHLKENVLLRLVIPKLQEKRTREIDRPSYPRQLFEKQRQPRVVLDPVKPDPGEHHSVGEKISIVRLVEMPQERELGHRVIVQQYAQEPTLFSYDLFDYPLLRKWLNEEDSPVEG